jgi:hypothetical protein
MNAKTPSHHPICHRCKIVHRAVRLLANSRERGANSTREADDTDDTKPAHFDLDTKRQLMVSSIPSGVPIVVVGTPRKPVLPRGDTAGEFFIKTPHHARRRNASG